MSPNRIVAVLTPLLFAPLAGAAATWLAQHFPGVDIDQKSLEEVFIAGALIGLAPAAQWLHGWQKFEARQAEKETAIELANIASPPESAPPEEFEEFEEPAEAEEAVEFEEIAESDEFDDLDSLEDELFADEQFTGSQG
jgi:hypothetical protein